VDEDEGRVEGVHYHLTAPRSHQSQSNQIAMWIGRRSWRRPSPHRALGTVLEGRGEPR